MSRAQELLDKAVKNLPHPTYMALAERMGLTRATMSQFKNGIIPIPDERVVQIAKIAGENPDLWLLIINAEQTHGEAGKAWARLVKKFGAAAAIALVALGVIAPVAPADAASAGNLNAGVPIHYAKLYMGLTGRHVSSYSLVVIK